MGRIDINVAEVICAFAPFEQKCGTVVRISFYLEKSLNPFHSGELGGDRASVL